MTPYGASNMTPITCLAASSRKWKITEMQSCEKVRIGLKKWLPLFVATGLITIIFVACWILIIVFIPQWQQRGLFGDAFGGLNAFVSGIALIGVVYAVFLQQRQLDEMRRSIELQQQPVVVFKTCEFQIDRPSVFTSPARLGCAALSRYHCIVHL